MSLECDILQKFGPPAMAVLLSENSIQKFAWSKYIFEFVFMSGGNTDLTFWRSGNLILYPFKVEIMKTDI